MKEKMDGAYRDGMKRKGEKVGMGYYEENADTLQPISHNPYVVA